MSKESKEPMFNSEVSEEDIDIDKELEALEKEIETEANQKPELKEGGDVSEDSLTEIEKAIDVFGKPEIEEVIDVAEEMKALGKEVKDEKDAKKERLKAQIAQLKKELGR